MVIHDLRNPTSQIKFAIDQALSSVDRVDLKTEKLEAIYISYINQLKESYKELQNELQDRIRQLKAEKQ